MFSFPITILMHTKVSILIVFFRFIKHESRDQTLKSLKYWFRHFLMHSSMRMTMIIPLQHPYETKANLDVVKDIF